MRGRIDDLTGQKFGKLTVVSLYSMSPTKWLCKCECGKDTIVSTCHLKEGHTKSCGCLRTSPRHPKEWKRIFSIWRHMKSRCYDENVREYKWYGKKGVTMCDEWLNYFETFFNWSISNGYKENLTIDRIDCNGNYCPENCRWTTKYVQDRNKTSKTWITYNNETMVMSDWAKRYNINSATLYSRIFERNWSIEDALNIPTLNKWEEKDEYKANLTHRKP